MIIILIIEIKKIYGNNWDLLQTADGSPPWEHMVKSENEGSLSSPEVEVYPSTQLAGDDTQGTKSLIRQDNCHECNTFDPTGDLLCETHFGNLVSAWSNNQKICYECSTLGPPGRVLCSTCMEKGVCIRKL